MANSVEMLSGRRKKDYAAESAAAALAAQAHALGVTVKADDPEDAPADEPDTQPAAADEQEEALVAA